MIIFVLHKVVTKLYTARKLLQFCILLNILLLISFKTYFSTPLPLKFQIQMKLNGKCELFVF